MARKKTNLFGIGFKEAMRYAIILAALAVTWVPMMNALGNNVWATLVGAFIVLIASDKFAQAVIK
jgi:hypothetical protein